MLNQPMEVSELTAIIAWKIWCARNRVCMEGEMFNIESTIKAAQTLFMEFLSCKQIDDTKGRKNTRVKWQNPRPGNLKLNTDCAKFNDGSVGYGFAVRDSQGDVLLAGTRRLNMEGSSTFIEGLALLYAMQKSLEAGFTDLWVECDSKELVDMLQQRTRPKIGTNIVAEDISKLAHIARVREFSFIRRSANSLADGLAHFAKKPAR
ncbi:hypothetical protein DH2020_031072 [Rehmannia glutinosa]|uniref:RNase H type-1 domain-containing protein n=1 Tax=Rehmannia glutinosa TaxID=99300 RepID=A0ABR0VLY9_REHGL